MYILLKRFAIAIPSCQIQTVSTLGRQINSLLICSRMCLLYIGLSKGYSVQKIRCSQSNPSSVADCVSGVRVANYPSCLCRISNLECDFSICTQIFPSIHWIKIILLEDDRKDSDFEKEKDWYTEEQAGVSNVQV